MQRFRDGVFPGWTLDDLEGIEVESPSTSEVETATPEDAPTSKLERQVEAAVTAFLASAEGKGELVSKTAEKKAELDSRRRIRRA